MWITTLGDYPSAVDSSFRFTLGRRILVADGAMGTMLQKFSLSLDDFQGNEGCNEILNLTRPDVVAAVHSSYFEAGADCVETNTFGANLSALAEYGITDQIEELAETGAQIARQVADKFATSERSRFVLGSVGPGTKLPSLKQVTFAELLDAYYRQTVAMIRGGIDAVQIETCQDLLQTKAAVIAAKRAAKMAQLDLPILVNVTVETTGTMLLGTEIGAALTALEPLGIDAIGLNCATGPDEMSEHLRHLSRHTNLNIGCMPNAGLPELTADGARYPLTAAGLGDALDSYADEFGLAIVGGCCGTTPEHISQLAKQVGARTVTTREVTESNRASSLYIDVPFTQEASFLSVGERTNANGSKAFREAMLAQDWDECLRIAKNQAREGANLLDLCVDYVGRDGKADMAECAAKFATGVTLPVMLDSTEPAVLQAGLEVLAGRCVINSVNYEDGNNPDSRFCKIMPLVKEHGAAVVALTIDEEGQARSTEKKLEVAIRLISDLVDNWGMDLGDILVDCLTFPIATGQEETRGDGLATIAAIAELKRCYPRVRTILGVSNISFGLNPAARIVLNSVFLDECVKAGLDAAIVHAEKIVPVDRIPENQYQVALDLIYDRRKADYDPLARFLELFEGVKAASVRSRAAELAALPLYERLPRRIVDGEAEGLAADLDEALLEKTALEIINDDLLAGMKTVGELFGAGKMQLPFVLQSAEVMKTAVAFLEPHLDKEDASGKGTIVLATVRGDVHDIGKNLVDIILSNNGYRVINLGIKQPIQAIIEAANTHQADAIGMSGLLVKSTMIMKDNLAEIDRQGLGDNYPILLGGAALTRAFVEHDLNEMFSGQVRYAKDAFEGLALMDTVMAIKRGEKTTLPPVRTRKKIAARKAVEKSTPSPGIRSDVARNIDVPVPPFWGTRVAKGIQLAEVSRWLDYRATFRGQWGIKGLVDGPSYDELVETEAIPRLRMWLDRIASESLVDFGVVYGYFPVVSRAEDLIVLDQFGDKELTRFTFPRQQRDRKLCLADFFRDEKEAEDNGPDVIAFQLVTLGNAVANATRKLFEANAYRDYLELHGLSVQLTEALAELWHSRIRNDFGFATAETTIDSAIAKQSYRGSRYSFGYPACPNMEDRRKLVDLLKPERIGVELSEELQLHPEQSTDALIVHHPEARYFNAG
ncbi:MAG: methionine synthase [Propionibacterium sp.]|nr:MAG: methionine synthase [Propionibacterium sp.]